MAWSLEQQYKRAVTAEEQKAGLLDGHLYKLNGQMVRADLRFYPKKRWMIEDMEFRKGTGQFHPLPGTYRPLTDEDKTKLESWL